MNIFRLIKAKVTSYSIILNYKLANIFEEDDDNDMNNNSKKHPHTKNVESICKDTGTEKLISRLRDIANDPTEYTVKQGQMAMCYCPSPESFVQIPCMCSVCAKKLKEIRRSDFHELVRESRLIKECGIAQVKIVCAECLIEMCLSGKYRYNITEWDNYEQMRWDYQKRVHDKSDGIDFSSDIRDIDILKSLNVKAYPHDPDEYYIVVIFEPTDVDTPHLAVTNSEALTYLLAFFNNCRKWEDPFGLNTILLRDNINIIERLTGLKL